MNRHTSGNDAGGRSPARRLLLLTILVATAALIVQVGSALAENSHLNYFPQTGELVYWRAVEFQNQAGQTFNRVGSRQIGAQHGVTHDLHVRPADEVPDGGD